MEKQNWLCTFNVTWKRVRVTIVAVKNQHLLTVTSLYLYSCLREEGRLRVFENRVLRRVFGHKMDEVTGEWRKLHNEELRDLHSLPNIVQVVKSRRMRWAGHVARMGGGERSAQDFGGET